MPHDSDATLVAESGPTQGSVWALDNAVCLLGRSQEADIVIDDVSVSRRHAEIVSEGLEYFIRDLGSINGTTVNGIRLLNERAQLHSGDRIELAGGRTVLRFMHLTTRTIPLENLQMDSLVVDAKSREVWLRGQKIEPQLTRKEFDLLNLLYARRGEAFSKDQIAAAAWPERLGGDVGDTEIEQCIRRIRLRIEKDPSMPQFILTVRGFGYKLSVDA